MEQMIHNTTLKKNAIINHQIIKSENHTAEDMKSLELTNSQIEQVNFVDVDISNSDIFSTKLYSVHFENVTFKHSDINSLWVTKSKFINVIFDGSTLADTTFVECKFINCSFSHIGMTNNQFSKCFFDKYHAEHCTITLNHFFECQIENSKICSTFYYQIFDGCQFVNVEFDNALLGYNYGILQGNNFFQINEIDDIKSDFLSKLQYLNAAIVEINRGEDILNTAMRACVYAIAKMIENDILLKSDEISYISNLFEYFYNKKMISPLSVIECWKILFELQEKQLTTTAFNKATDEIRKLLNILYLKYQEYLNELALYDIPKMNMNSTVEIEMHYIKKPQVELVEIINKVIKNNNLSIPEAKLVKTAQGSFIEWIQANAAIVPYIQTFISLMGVFVPVIYKQVSKKGEAKVDSHKDDISKQPKEALLVEQSSKTEINLPVLSREKNSNSEEMVSQIISIAIDNKIANTTDYLGYNNINVITINVNYPA